MKVNTNRWNKIRYTLYSPGYDLVAQLLNKSRKRSIESLSVKPNDKVLIIGAGTGLDLELLPDDCEIIAIDITPAMVERMKRRNKKLNLHLQAMVMDGQTLDFANSSFDKVILHLILSVIPNPKACIKEVERVLKTDGEVVVYDKFIRKGTKSSLCRRFANLFTSLLFSDITRNFESIASSSRLKVVSDVDAGFNGNFRIIKMVK